MRARRLWRGLSNLILGIVPVLLLAPEAGAQIPATITYQGRLSGPGGPVSDTLPMTFAIYDQKSGPAPPLVPLWTETHPAVVVEQGQFTVELGSITSFASASLAFDVPYFLGTTVGNDSEMHPRLPFTSVGYSLNSVHAQNADHAGNSDHANNSDHSDNSDHSNNADHAQTASTLSPNICSEGEVLRKTATEWECSLAVGPEGPPGPQGVQGPAGPSGPAGPGVDDFKNIAIVTLGFRDGAPVSGAGLYNDPVAAMNDVGTWCGVPVDANRCLLKIMPGVYDIGASALVLQPFVTVAGSGTNATTIRGSGGSSALSAVSAVVFGAENAELRSLTIEGSGPADAVIANDGTAATGASSPTYSDIRVIAGQISTAVFNRQSSPVLRDATIAARTVGIRNDNATPSLSDVTITVSSAAPASAAEGVNSSDSGEVVPGGSADAVPAAAARVRMSNVTVRVSGGPTSAGLVNDRSHLELANVRIEVSGSGQLHGIKGSESRIAMTDTQITIEGGANSAGMVGTDCYVTIDQTGITVEHGKAAVEVAGSQGFLIVNHSALVHSGGSAIIKGVGGLPALLGQTKLVGIVSPGLTCVNVYDGETYLPVACPL